MQTILMQQAMRLIVASAVIGTLAGCQRRAEDTGRTAGSADTIVTTQQRQDTSIITRDTQVDVDTVRKEGETRPTRRDTTSGAAGRMGDTTMSDTTRP